MNNIDRLRKELSPERKRKIAARVATILAEERSLQELRRAHKLTQKKMAEVLGVGQDSVSRLEQRSDLLISTLRGYVEAMGGKLSLVAEFPDQEPVILTGLAALDRVFLSGSRGARLAVSTPQAAWANDLSRLIQQLFFPEGIAFDGRDFVRTAALAFSHLQPVAVGNKGVVGASGFEPLTPAV